jgi:hypothetical protein
VNHPGVDKAKRMHQTGGLTGILRGGVGQTHLVYCNKGWTAFVAVSADCNKAAICFAAISQKEGLNYLNSR